MVALTNPKAEPMIAINEPNTRAGTGRWQAVQTAMVMLVMVSAIVTAHNDVAKRRRSIQRARLKRFA